MTEKQLESFLDYIAAAVEARLSPLYGPIDRERMVGDPLRDAERDLRLAFRLADPLEKKRLGVK